MFDSNDNKFVLGRRNSRMVVASVFALAAASGANAQGAPAQADASAAVDEIIVTAQRRSERLRDVPIAVTALSEERLERAGITDTKQLQRDGVLR